ncbi:MAG: hypothetical protein GXP55_10915 [Deltaproteobacteria bacterium]|nr:hypothetical protein [Deltaproteobacteria bacterium]
MTRTFFASSLTPVGLGALLALAAYTPTASAQDSAGAEELGYRPNEGANLLLDDQAGAEDEAESPSAVDPTDPHEEDSKDYYFLGAFYRHSFIPSFMIDLFTQEATRARNPGFGLEFTMRKAGFSIITSLFYQRFAVDGPFLANGDPPAQVEFIESDLFTVMGGVDFMWSTPINDMFSFEYGMGVGLGVVGGDLVRTEAYPDDGPGSVDGFSPCVGPGTGPGAAPNGGVQPGSPASAGGGGYCDAPSGSTQSVDYTDRDGGRHTVRTNIDGQRGAQYHIKARRWTNGGSVPNVWFRLSLPHIALRFKPIHQFQMRVDGGFDIFSGFFVGGALAYGF